MNNEWSKKFHKTSVAATVISST